MIPLTTTKLAVNIVSALGVSKVIGDIVKNNVTVITTSQRVLTQVGGFVLGSMVVEQAVNHVNKMVDEVVVSLQNKGVNIPDESDTPGMDAVHDIH